MRQYPIYNIVLLVFIKTERLQIGILVVSPTE